MSAKKAAVVENLAAEYFEEAVRAFLDTTELTSRSRSPDATRCVNRTLRMCTLFSAFAAEAFVNAFLELGLGSDKGAELDRNPTARKYVLATEEGTSEKQLDLGRAPLQIVAELFKRRDALVHARPRRVQVDEYGIRISAMACARSLLAVADCVLVLNESLAETEFMGPIERMHDLGDEIDPDWDMIEAEQLYFFTVA